MSVPELDYVHRRLKQPHTMPDVHEGYPPGYPGSIGEVMCSQRNADAAGISSDDPAHEEMLAIRDGLAQYHRKRLPMHIRPFAAVLDWVRRHLEENEL